MSRFMHNANIKSQTWGNYGSKPAQIPPAKSMREQAFFWFDHGMKPPEVAKRLEMKITTTYRYYSDWNKLPPLFKMRCQLARRHFKKLSQDDRAVVARSLARELGTSEESVLREMGKPWAIKQMVTGEWRYWPVEPSQAQPKGPLRRRLRALLSLKQSSDVKLILELALDQSYNPLDEIHVNVPSDNNVQKWVA